MALVTAADLTASLGIDATNPAAPGLAAAADAAVKRYLGWNPEVTTYTDYLDPNGGADLSLISAPPGCPVSITGVWEDSGREFPPETELVSGEDYIQIQGPAIYLPTLRRINRNWPHTLRRAVDRLAGTVYSNVGVVKVTYTVDTSGVLAVARAAALAEAGGLFNLQAVGKGLGTVTSTSVDGLSITLDKSRSSGRRQNSADGFVSPFVAGMLDPFRRLTVV